MSESASPEQHPARVVLTIAEVASELGCGRNLVYRLLASGQLPSVLVGKRLRRIRRLDLDTYVDGLAASLPHAARR